MAGWWGGQYWGAQYWGAQYWGVESSGYDQTLDVSINLYSLTTQEYLPPSVTPALYTQVGNARLIHFGSAAQEYVAPLAGTYGQSGNVRLQLRPNAFQQWVGGSLPGDVLQDGNVTLSLQPDAIQQYLPVSFVIELVTALDSIEALYFGTPTRVSVDFSDQLVQVGRINLLVSSEAAAWGERVGEAGGNVGVAIYGVSGGERMPIASVSVTNPEVVLYPDVDGPFAWLAPKLISGAVQFELGGYEALPTKSIPTLLAAPATFTTKVLQQ